MATSLLQIRVEDSLKELYSADRGYRAMIEIGEASEKNGVSDMTLDEINAEIEASRKERQVVGK